MAYSKGISVSIGGNTDGALAQISTGTMFLAGGNNITLSQNGNSVTVSGASIPTASINISAGTLSQDLAAVTFADSNGVSFGLNNSVITATVRTNYLTTQTVQTQNMVSINGSTGNISFVNSNGITFGGNASTITASHNGLTSQSNQALSAGNGSFTFQTATFADSNGVSFSTGTQGLYATVKTDYLTTQTVQTQNRFNLTLSGNTSGALAQVSSGTLTLAGGNNITLSQNGNAITISGANAPSSPINFSAGTASADLGSVVFSNSNGVSFGLNGSTITASHNGLTSQSNQAISGSNGSFTFQTATFGNANGMSFLSSNGSLVGSYTVPTVTNSSWTVSNSATSATVGRLAFTDANGITFGLSTSNNGNHTISASHNGLTSQSNQALSGSNGSFTFQTATFGNLNGMSFYSSNGSMVGSYTVPTQSNQTIGAYAVSNTTQSTSGTIDARSLSFNGAGGVSVGVSNGSVVISGATGGGAGGGVAIAASNSTFTSGTVVMSNNGGALTISNGAQSVLFSVPQTSSLSGTGGITLSTNGSTISVGAPANYTASRYYHPNFGFVNVGAFGVGSLSMKQFTIPHYLSGSAARLAVSISANTNTSVTTASANLTVNMGIYTNNGGTLSLASSGSQTYAFAWSVSNSSTGNSSINSMRELTVPMNVSLTPGQYFIGAAISRVTTYTSFAMSMIGGIDWQATAYMSPIGSNTTANQPALDWQGIYTANTNAMPTSISKGQINYTSVSNVSRAMFHHQLYNESY